MMCWTEPSRKKTTRLAFHAESLHNPLVWRRVEAVARWMSRRGMRATFFVYPFKAQMAGRDVTDQVRALAAMEHEIAQHTHFYAGARIDKSEKANDLRPSNIAHCLRRDLATLEVMGVTPRGFTAGAWMVDETVWDLLIELEFTYDCSVRFPKPSGTGDLPYYRWQRVPTIYANGKGNIQFLPTTCSLGEWFRWGRNVTISGAVPYQLVYLHDYDLLRPQTYGLFSLFLLLNRRTCVSGVGDLVQRISESGVAWAS